MIFFFFLLQSSVQILIYGMFLSGLNEHFKTVGKTKIPKRAFSSKEEADYFIDCVINDKKARSYKCSVCGKWHVGH